MLTMAFIGLCVAIVDYSHTLATKRSFSATVLFLSVLQTCFLTVGAIGVGHALGWW